MAAAGETVGGRTSGWHEWRVADLMRGVNLYVGHVTKILGPGGYIESSYDLATANPPPPACAGPGLLRASYLIEHTKGSVHLDTCRGPRGPETIRVRGDALDGSRSEA